MSQASSPRQESWTPEDENRLMAEQAPHAKLTWTGFHKPGLFPGRSLCFFDEILSGGRNTGTRTNTPSNRGAASTSRNVRATSPGGDSGSRSHVDGRTVNIQDSPSFYPQSDSTTSANTEVIGARARDTPEATLPRTSSATGGTLNRDPNWTLHNNSRNTAPIPTPTSARRSRNASILATETDRPNPIVAEPLTSEQCHASIGISLDRLPDIRAETRKARTEKEQTAEAEPGHWTERAKHLEGRLDILHELLVVEKRARERMEVEELDRVDMLEDMFREMKFGSETNTEEI
ncbi:hypothetical protein BJX70DRAFT_395303 [Aspergillus crustosus]